MQIFATPESLGAFLSEHRKQDRSIGLVPTMGALHQGHFELIQSSLKKTDITVCSIYVNPTQFNDSRDLANYPRNLDHDLETLKNLGCQAVYCPTDEVMYSSEPGTTLSFGKLESTMEGLYRPGHFKGVALVVAKLFNMVQPDFAFFGTKDLQQLIIIKQLVLDLRYPLKIVAVPIVREPDGLALSSRNLRLSAVYRPLAAELFRTLQIVKIELEKLSSPGDAVKSGIRHLDQFPPIELEYLKVVQTSTLEEVTSKVGEEPLSVCIAGIIDNIRLIDNVSVFSKY